MHRPKLLSTVFLVFSASFFVGNVPACGTTEEEPGIDPRYTDVTFRNGTTDEALGALLASAPIKDPARAPELLYPTRGAHVPVAPAAVVRWKALPSLATRDLPLPFRPTEPRPAWSPIPSAHAHGPAFTGPGYFLVLQTPKDQAFLRVFTTETSYQVDEGTWAALIRTRAATVVSVTAGYIEGNGLRPNVPVAQSDVLPFYIDGGSETPSPGR